MLVTPLPIVTLARLVQESNAAYPMLVTLLGMMMLVKLVQPPKAASPMMVTLSGIVTLVMLMLSKASCPMVVTGRLLSVLGIAMETAPPNPIYLVIVIVPLLVV